MTLTKESITIHIDGMVVLAYSKDPKYHGRTKYIDICFHYIRDIVTQREVVLKHIYIKKVFQTQVRSLGLCKL